jgi:hypothetical protein
VAPVLDATTADAGILMVGMYDAIHMLLSARHVVILDSCNNQGTATSMSLLDADRPPVQQGT